MYIKFNKRQAIGFHFLDLNVPTHFSNVVVMHLNIQNKLMS